MDTTTSAMPPIAGIKVVEMATNASGPFCGQILGDLGADVIKIEAITGDVSRHAPPFHKGQSGQFSQWNRNKKSIGIDVKNPRGLEIAKNILSTADVFFENMRPGVADSIGLGYEALKEINPGIIYLSINGFGNTGPYKKLPAYDPVVQGLTGFMYVQGIHGQPEPVRGGVVDKITGMSGALAIVAALYHRLANNGVGQQINVNMLDAYSAYILPEHMGVYTFSGSADKSSPMNIFHLLKAKDGYLTGLIQKTQLEAACNAFGRTDLLTDPRFESVSGVFINQEQLIEEFSKVTVNMTKAEIFEIVQKYQLPLAPVNTFEEYFEDPQVKHNQSYVDFPDEELGPLRLINSFAKFGSTPATIRSRPPKLGEQTHEILQAQGLSDEDIASLRDAKVIR